MKKRTIGGVLFLVIACSLHGSGSTAIAASSGSQAGEGRGEDVYRTPLAGEPREVEFMGERVSIPAVDRAHMNAITVGGSLLAPRQGDTRGVPIAALYLRHFEKVYRGRAVVSILLNEVEVARKTGPLELVGQFRNYTLPVGQTEVVENDEVKATSVRWGTFLAGVGPGLRIPVSPFQVDNDFRLQLLGRGGYFYAERTRHSGPEVAVPPDTWLYGARFRMRYDGMRRNLLELPHKGLSMGVDLDYLHRDQWRDMAAAGGNADARNYLQASGHLVAVGGVPQLSERDRFIVNIYGEIGRAHV